MTGSGDDLFSATQRALAGVYSLERELGRGGMGVVYLAREVELDRHVALKVLPPVHAEDATIRARFLREARVAASLSHPHIVPIFRVGEAGRVVYFSMGFVDGHTLGERLRSRGPLAPSAATRLLREVAQALAYSHGRGVVHRDIKPDNILLDRESGRAMVTDFGIAGGTRDAESDGPIMGTRHFMSPEQAAGAAAGPASDLYSLGVVGHLSLSGRLPSGTSLGEDAPSTPAHLVRAIDRSLAREPDARHASAEAFADAIESRAVARVELPEPLRAWVETRDPWTFLYVSWSLAWATAGVVGVLKADGRADALAMALAVLPVIPAALFQLRGALRMFAAGYTVDDLRAALDVWAAERDAKRLEQPAARAPWWHALARFAAWAPAASIVAVELFRLPRGWVTPTTFVAAVLAFPTLNAIGVPIFPRVVSAPEKSFSRMLWHSRLGAWLERTMMRGRQRAIASHTFRPTESVLGSAVEELFRALPESYRIHLRDLPRVIERLQEHAARARESLAHLDGVTAVARDTELSSARERARRELTESVSALETIRLDLLRLVGGDADLRATTTVLSAAQRVSDDLDRLSDGQRAARHQPPPLGIDVPAVSPG